MLLFAHADDMGQPGEEHLMSGNRLEAGSLDLEQEYEEIAAQLDRITFGVLTGQSCDV